MTTAVRVEPAPERCPHCDAGHPRSFGQHFLFVNREWRVLGPCTAPDVVPVPEVERLDTFHARVKACRERVDVARGREVLRALPPAPVPFNEQGEREPGSDG